MTGGKLLAIFRSRWADNIYVGKSADNGRTWSKPVPTELPNNNSSIQFTRLNNGHLAMVFNNINSDSAIERRSSLYDEIEDEADEIQLDTKVQAVTDDANKRTAFWGTPRAPMTNAISEDGGQTWPTMKDIGIGDGYCMTNNSKEKLNREYSYPSIKQTPDGKIHITFTYFRQTIKYVCITEDWVRLS